MKRRDFLRGLLGLPALPLVARALEGDTSYDVIYDDEPIKPAAAITEFTNFLDAQGPCWITDGRALMNEVTTGTYTGSGQIYTYRIGTRP